MTTLSSFNRTDLVDDVVAADVNKLIANALRAEYSNLETLSAKKTLTDNDTPIQAFTVSSAQTVVLPAESTANHIFAIRNDESSSADITVKDDSETDTIATLAAGSVALFVSDGTKWNTVSGSGGGSGGDFSDGGEAGGAARSLGNTDNFDLSLLTNNLARQVVHDNGIISMPYQSLTIATGNSTTQSVATGTITVVQLPTVVTDRHSEFNNTTYKWTAKEDGIYLAVGSLTFAQPSDQTQMNVYIYQNSTAIVQGRFYAPVGAKNHIFQAIVLADITAGDTMDLRGIHYEGSNLNFDLNSFLTWLRIIKVA